MKITLDKTQNVYYICKNNSNMNNEPSPLAAALIKQGEIINANLDRLHDIINKAERGAMGLTLDSSKTPEWRKAKHEYDMMFCRLRSVNQQLNKLRKHVGFECIDGKRVSIYKYK